MGVGAFFAFTSQNACHGICAPQSARKARFRGAFVASRAADVAPHAPKAVGNVPFQTESGGKRAGRRPTARYIAVFAKLVDHLWESRKRLAEMRCTLQNVVGKGPVRGAG
jgi:hypothetical protein